LIRKVAQMLRSTQDDRSYGASAENGWVVCAHNFLNEFKMFPEHCVDVRGDNTYCTLQKITFVMQEHSPPPQINTNTIEWILKHPLVL
jgi:hypothetical protein